MIIRPCCVVMFGLAVLMAVGCGSREPKVHLTRIDGRVLVDGQAAEGVMFTICPIDKQGTIATGTTDEEGSLTVSTYETGDGLCPGPYQVTCQWGEFDPVSRQYINDQLAGRYSNASESGIVWDVIENESQDVGEIRLSTR